MTEDVVFNQIQTLTSNYREISKQLNVFTGGKCPHNLIKRNQSAIGKYYKFIGSHLTSINLLTCLAISLSEAAFWLPTKVTSVDPKLLPNFDARSFHDDF